MEDNFYKNKKILITGHTGFKGSWLSLWLQNKEAHVIGYALPPPTKPNLFDIANVSQGMISITGDIRDLQKFISIISKYKPEIIIHMAAQSLVRQSYSHPIETFSTNVMGTVNVLEAVRQSESVRVLVCITSDKCYENMEWFWGYRENERLGGTDPYSGSKACAELAIAAYRNSYFSPTKYQGHKVAVASTRAGNVIGGGDWAKDRLIPDIMSAMMENRPVIIRSLNSIRPWQHVLEPLNGYLSVAQHLWNKGTDFAQSWNFGPNDEEVRSVSWIVEYMTSLWGRGARWEIDSAQQPHENIYLKLDCSKAKSLLKWSPKLKLDTSLEWIFKWYRSYQQNENMRHVTEAQITHYEKLEL
jgi:CDP-glucose 4,6-dehydratase